MRWDGLLSSSCRSTAPAGRGAGGWHAFAVRGKHVSPHRDPLRVTPCHPRPALRRGANRMFALPAFSLAEMMIALIILGFGLLVVGAALPVGYNYTRQSADLVNGEIAVETALDAIEAQIAMRRLDNSDNTPYPRIDPIFRPREINPVNDAFTLPRHWWEPRIKVRPLLGDVLDHGARDAAGVTNGRLTSRRHTPSDAIWGMTEGLIALWMMAPQPFGLEPTDQFTVGLEWDARRVLPPLPMSMMVYPAVTPAVAFSQAGLSPGTQNAVIRSFSSNFWSQTRATNPASLNPQYVAAAAGELQKMRERSIAFAAFYRRVNYGNPGPNGVRSYQPGVIGPGDDDPGDPNLYELIVVAMRRPTEQHRFPIFDVPLSPNPFTTPDFTLQLRTRAGVPPVPITSVVPVPILVGFEQGPAGSLMEPALTGVYVDQVAGPNNNNRILPAGYNPPTTLSFRASVFVGAMLAPGAVIIPAANDDFPDSIPPLAAGQNPVRHAGFVPHCPTQLPLFRVKQRHFDTNANQYVVEVDCNGFYPWYFRGGLQGVRDWPVWIIPPAFTETTGGRPVFEDAGVLAVGRRFVRFPETSP